LRTRRGNGYLLSLEKYRELGRDKTHSLYFRTLQKWFSTYKERITFQIPH